VKITKVKDGRTHLARKAEHAVDLETGAVVIAPRGEYMPQQRWFPNLNENLHLPCGNQKGTSI